MTPKEAKEVAESFEYSRFYLKRSYIKEYNKHEVDYDDLLRLFEDETVKKAFIAKAKREKKLKNISESGKFNFFTPPRSHILTVAYYI